MNTLFINLNDPVVFQSFGGEAYWTKVAVLTGSVIFPEGEESRDFYYIFDGLVKVTKSLEHGKEAKKHLATLSTGDFFGEGALLSDKSRGASVEALEETTLLKLSQTKFESLITKDPQAAVGIVLGIGRVLNTRLQSMNERFVALERISKLVRENKGNVMETLLQIFKELQAVLHHESMVLFSEHAQVKYATPNVTPEWLDVCRGPLEDYWKRFQKSDAPFSYRDEDRVYILVKNLQGKVCGVLVSPLCPLCEEEDLKILLIASEQMGNLIE